MTSGIDQATIPLLPTKDTSLRMRNFSQSAYRTDESSALYAIVDALTGDAGAGTLKKEMLITRLSQSLNTTYFSDLDNAFGNISGLARLASESYSINPVTGIPIDPSLDILTTDQWDEVHVKDSWFRARIVDFFTALALGGTPDGLRLMVKAAIGVDAEVYELWRFQDHYASIYGVADMEIFKNLILTPSFEAATVSGWNITGGGTGAALTADNALPAAVQSGSYTLKFSSGTTITNGNFSSAPVTVQAGEQYTLSTYYYRPTASTLNTMKFDVLFFNKSGGALTTSTSSTITMAATTLTRTSFTFTAPANAVTSVVKTTILGSVTTPSQVFYFDAWMYSGGTLQAYFDGNTSGYRWYGDVANSISVIAGPMELLGQTKSAARNEVIIWPHKATITPQERFIIKQMIRRLAPVDSIMTVKNSGYAVNIPIPTDHVSADSTFFQISSVITGAVGSTLSAAEEQNASFRWVQEGIAVLAPQPAFSETSEYAEYYTITPYNNSSIDFVNYQSIDPGGNVRTEAAYTTITSNVNTWGPWIPFAKADSPDNFPGGKNGRTPTYAPAKTMAGKNYVFPYTSQFAYVQAMEAKIIAQGGQARSIPGESTNMTVYKKRLDGGQVTDTSYRLPLSVTGNVKKTWKPEQAVANTTPNNSSTVITGWYSRTSAQFTSTPDGA